jgi:hypothetical protein
MTDFAPKSRGGDAVKTLPLQLVTVELENGQRGVFVVLPLIPDTYGDADSQVEDIWFSDTQEVPEQLTVTQLLELLQRQFCRCRSRLQ